MGKIDVYEKIVIENKQKKKRWKSKKFLHKSPSKRRCRNRIHSLIRRADAIGSAHIIVPYVTHRYFADQALLMTSQRRSRTEYLLSTDNIIVLDCYFNLSKKSNLIGRL